MKETEGRQAQERIQQASSEAELRQLRIDYLGRKGSVTESLRGISKLPADRRGPEGKRLNVLKQELEGAIKQRSQSLLEEDLVRDGADYDLTRPGVGPERGKLHPVESMLYESIYLFNRLGFSVAKGPEIEDDWHNFEALNMGASHPARDMQDTFYLENGAIPRTHTSSVQIRYMEQHKPPIRIIAPGKVYRNEDEDATHLWSFRQIEGLVVDEGISMSDLKGTLQYMLKGLFGDDAQLRLRPSYFPYTEPSVEMDASCMFCDGPGNGACRICSGTGWVELGGAGMVHPNVLRNVSIDPEVYSGFAFGFGLERITAIKYQLADLRDLWRPNLDFLEQF